LKVVGAPISTESKAASFEEAVYKLFRDDIVNPLLVTARLGRGRYVRLPLKARVLKDVPGDADLRRQCDTWEDLLSVSGLRVDAADGGFDVRCFRNVARWWLAYGGVRSWKDTLWRAIVGALQRPIHPYNTFGASERSACYGTKFSLREEISGYGVVVNARAFHNSDTSDAVDADLDSALPPVPFGARRLFHGTTAARATGIIMEVVFTRYVRGNMTHDFGEAFYMTPELHTACHFAVCTALGDGHRELADDDPAVLVLDVDSEQLYANLQHYECREIEPWQRLLRHYVRRRSLAEASESARANGADVIEGPLCENNTDVQESDEEPVAHKTRSQLAFKVGKGMDFVSVGRPGSGVVAVHVLHANVDQDIFDALLTADADAMMSE
jgi:hypothetical protein